MKNLMIVESGAKAKIISKYLNNEYTVVASLGHIQDLKPNQLSINIEHDFYATFEPLADKRSIIKQLKKNAKEADVVYLATDMDREGENIAWSLLTVLKPKKYHRILFTEITQKAIEYAIQHPRTIDQNMVDSQFTRRALDRIVGYKLSPLLWKKFDSKTILSAGRVQSALLHLIVNHENTISNFETTPYWHVVGNFAEFENFGEFTLHNYDSKNIQNFLSNIKNHFVIS